LYHAGREYSNMMVPDQDGRVVVSIASVPRSEWYARESIAAQIGDAAVVLGWGSRTSPFAGIIKASDSVVVKPNWVMHRNHGPWGIEPVVTHPTLVKAVVEFALESDAAHVCVGDAPLQTCEIGALLSYGDLGRWAAEVTMADRRFSGVRDFRRTRSAVRAGVLVQQNNAVDESQYVLFDLGTASFLEPVSNEHGTFRVTQYDPSFMAVTHGSGRHCYLVAKDVIDSTVVVNVPKLKMHKKAGLTCALKNIVGINGNKEFLPHHRVGGSARGGDCYPGRSRVKELHERALDALNGSHSFVARSALSIPAQILSIVGRLVVDDIGVEGAWVGNDTVWRMVLDLNRILHYGCADGSLSDTPQRRVLSIVDALVAGQGDGPLAPEPFELGALLFGRDSAATDWVAAGLLGYDPASIRGVAEAFSKGGRWPLTNMDPSEVNVVWRGSAAARSNGLPTPTRYPEGWSSARRKPARVV
jgi:uncharacterized protein (DUF362 family)